MSTYKIEVPHFYEIRYIEGDHSMTIEVDLRESVPCLYKSAIRAWDTPFSDEPISDGRTEEILQRVHEHLTRVRKFSRVEIDRG